MHSCMDHAARSGTAGRLSMVITANLEHEPYLAGGRSHCRPIEQGNPSSLYSMRRVLCSLRGSCLRSLVDDAAGLALAALDAAGVSDDDPSRHTDYAFDV